jgi:hypothetical protein
MSAALSTRLIRADDATHDLLGHALYPTPAVVERLLQMHADDFPDPSERKVFRAILSVVADGDEPDLVTVGAKLPAMRDFLHTLVDTRGTASNAGQYVALAQDATLRRQLVTACLKTQEMLAETNGTPAAELVKRCRDLYDLPSSGPEEPRAVTAVALDALEFPHHERVALYAGPGDIFDLAGKPKKGKTTFILYGVKALLAGESFLDMPTHRCAVVYLTELTRRSFQRKLRSVGLTKAKDLHLFFRADFAGWTWADICRHVAGYCGEHGIRLIVVDTLSDWASVKDEDDNAEAIAVMAPLRVIAEADIAIWTARHAGKGDSGHRETVDVGRGASAYAGVVDTLCVLEGAQGQKGHPNRRQLRLVSRDDDVPERVTVELKDGRYISHGDAFNVETREARAHALDLLGDDEASAKRITTLLERDEGDDFSHSTMNRALDGLMHDGLVTGRKGAGEASSRAFGYWIRGDDEQLGMSDDA